MLHERYKAGDPEVGLLGEPSGKFDYYVLYPKSKPSPSVITTTGSPSSSEVPPVDVQEQSDAVSQLCTEMATVILNETESPELPPQNDEWECNMISAEASVQPSPEQQPQTVEKVPNPQCWPDIHELFYSIPMESLPIEEVPPLSRSEQEYLRIEAEERVERYLMKERKEKLCQAQNMEFDPSQLITPPGTRVQPKVVKKNHQNATCYLLCTSVLILEMVRKCTRS